MTVTLSDEARQIAGLFEEATGAIVRDCIVDSSNDRVIVLVKTGQMAEAIGPGGKHVQAVEEKLGKSIKLVEDAPTPEDFVANALAPAAVYSVTIAERETETVASAEVADEDRGAAIGKDGTNIDAARTLVERHYDIDDIELS